MADRFDYLEGALRKQVRHKMLGVGTITEVNTTTGVLKVKFNSSSIRFQFPNSFNDGTLSFIVPETTAENTSKVQNKQSVYKKASTDSWASDEEDVSWVSTKRSTQPKVEPQNSPKARPISASEQLSQNITVRSKSHDINNPYDDWDDELVRSCNNCREYKRGDCAGLRNAKTCSDYVPIPRISNAEKYTWPTQGDALNFKLGKNKK